MRGGHGRPDRGEKISAQRVEIDHVTQPVGEQIEGARRVVTRAVEAPVDGVLHAAADRLEECERNQSGGASQLMIRRVARTRSCRGAGHG